MYGDGEAIVRQGDPGHSMFIVGSGRALVVMEPDRREVATIERGGYLVGGCCLTGTSRASQENIDASCASRDKRS